MSEAIGRRGLRRHLPLVAPLIVLLLAAKVSTAGATEFRGGALTLGYDRLDITVPVLPDRQMRGASVNLRGALGGERFRLDAEARLRQMRMGASRYDLRWIDLAPSLELAPGLRVGLYHTRFPMRLRADHAVSHRWRATGAMLGWTGGGPGTAVRLSAIAGRLDGNGGGRAREYGASAALVLAGRTEFGAMANRVRGRSNGFRYATSGIWAAHRFDFGLTGFVAAQDLRLRPGSERLRTLSAGLAQEVALAGRPVVLSLEASRTRPRVAPHRMAVLRAGLTVPLGEAARSVPLNSTLAAMQRRPNFLFGFFDSVANGM